VATRLRRYSVSGDGTQVNLYRTFETQTENKSAKDGGLNAALAEAIVHHKSGLAFFGTEPRGCGWSARKASQDETAILVNGRSDRRRCRSLIQ
jgi:hypothetical protein